MKNLALITVAACALSSASHAALTPISSLSSYNGGTGTGWTGIGYSNPALADPTQDHQTGGVEGDLVGNATVPFFYTAFDDNGSLFDNDGTISFRTRHGGDANPAGYKGALSVGIDANADGMIDGFVGVNNSGGSDGIYFWNATAAPTNNVSIATLAFGTIHTTITQTTTNYNWREVVAADVPGASLDLDGDTGAKNLIDSYLSFSVDFGDLLTFLEAGILANSAQVVNLTQNSGFSYIVGSSTQGNNFNQDTGGLNGMTGEEILFSDPSSPISLPYTADGSVAVPEPSSASLLIGASALLLMRRKRD